MTGRQKVKLLIVVWGDRYVRDLSRIALPALLSSNNLLFLARETDLEVLIMTERGSVKFFDREAAYSALRSLCPVRYVFIDDLIPGGNFGVTLTLAYARGIRDSGDEQTSTYFIFMNADFVMADGALRTLHTKMEEGHPVVFAPSLRACSESVEPLLEEAIDPETCRLEMAPRDMVRLTLHHLHPTVIAKTITQGLVRCDEYNHLYWQVDSSTLLARNYLIFIPMIKPERPMPPVNSYSDYGFVPELVPSGRMIALGDSDEFFMLELQRTAQEGHRLACGSKPSAEEIAEELSRWTTREHRFVAEHDFVFHSGDLPPNLPSIRAQASEYMKSVTSLMSSQPISHVDHPYWTSGLSFWLALRPRRYQTVAELAANPSHPNQPATSAARPLIRYLRRTFGTSSQIPIWRHHWLDARVVFSWIDSLANKCERRNLLLFSAGSILASSHSKLASFEQLEVGSLIEAEPEGHAGSARYTNVLCHVSSDHIKHIRAILERTAPLFEEDVEIAIYMETWNFAPRSGSLVQDLAASIQDFLPKDWMDFEVGARFVGSRVKQWLRTIEIRLINRIVYPSRARLLLLPAVASGLLLVLGLTALNNWRLRNRTEDGIDSCSSALVRMRRTNPVSPSAFIQD